MLSAQIQLNLANEYNIHFLIFNRSLITVPDRKLKSIEYHQYVCTKQEQTLWEAHMFSCHEITIIASYPYACFHPK